MLASIPLPLFFEWMEYARRQPFGEERADLRIGYGLAKLATLWTSQGTKPSDFMPTFAGRAAKKRQTPQEVRNLVEHMMVVQQRQLKNADRNQPSS